jgi:hypothetical protein
VLRALERNTYNLYSRDHEQVKGLVLRGIFALRRAELYLLLSLPLLSRCCLVPSDWLSALFAGQFVLLPGGILVALPRRLGEGYLSLSLSLSLLSVVV